MSEVEELPSEYWAFISYRHQDNRVEGRRWATWLHQSLEQYEVPKDLIGTVNERGDTIPEKIFPIFRDEEELPADADLAEPIRRALDRSKLLIVLCSPRAASSQYVADEILQFKQAGKQSRILAVLLDGEPNASRDSSKEALECFPKPLMHPVDSDCGELLEDEWAEPIAAELRLPGGGEGWTSTAAYRSALKKEGVLNRTAIQLELQRYEEQRELAKLKIVAGILGVPLGQLTERDKAYRLHKAKIRQRILISIIAIISVLAVAAAIAGYFAVVQKDKAEQSLREIREGRSRYLADLSRQRVDEHRFADALALASMATPTDQPDWPIMQTAVNAVQYAYQRYRSAPLRPEVGLVGHTGTVEGGFFFGGDARFVSWSYDGTARIWDTATGETLQVLKHEVPIREALITTDEQFIITRTSRRTVGIWNARDGNRVATLLPADTVMGMRLSEDSSKLLTWGSEGSVRIWEISTGNQLMEFTNDSEALVWEAQFFQGSSHVLARSFDGTISLIDTSTGQEKYRFEHESDVNGFIVTDDAARLISWSHDKTVRMWSLENGAELKRWDLKDEVGGLKERKDLPEVYAWAGDALYVLDTESMEQKHEMLHDGSVLGAMETLGLDGFVTRTDTEIVSLWSAGSGELLDETSFNSGVFGVSKMPGSNHIFIFLIDGELAVWENPGEEKSTVRTWEAHEGRIISGSVSSNGAYSWSWSTDGTLKSYNIATGQLWGSLVHQGSINALVASESGSLIATASDDGTARITKIAPKDYFKNYKLSSNVAELAFQEDTLLVATDDGRIHFLDYKRGEKPLEIETGISELSGFCLSPDGKHSLVWNDGGAFRVVDLLEGKTLMEGQAGGEIEEAAFYSGGQHAYLREGQGTVHLIAANQGVFELKQTLFDCESVTLCEDGNSIIGLSTAGYTIWVHHPGLSASVKEFGFEQPVFGYYNAATGTLTGVNLVGEAKVWDMRSGELRHSYSDDFAQRFVVDPQGDALLSIPNFGRPIVYELHTGRRLGMIDQKNVVFAHFFMDGRRILTVSKVRLAAIWEYSESSGYEIVSQFAVDYSANYEVDATERYFSVGGKLYDLQLGEALSSMNSNGTFRLSPGFSHMASYWSSSNLVRIESLLRGLEWNKSKIAETLDRGLHLSASELVKAYEDLGQRNLYWSADETSLAVAGNASADSSGTAFDMKSLDFIRLEIMVTSRGGSMLLSDQDIYSRISRIEFDKYTQRMNIIIDDQLTDLGVPIEDRLWRYFATRSEQRMLFVYMRIDPTADGGYEILSGGFIPIFIY